MNTIIYVHLPKAAGRTLTDVVYRQYWPEKDRIWKTKGYFDGSFFRDGTEEVILEEQPAVVLGHLYYGLHERLSWPCEYATMLRDPMDRALSQYFHFRRAAEHPLHEAAMERDLEAFLKRGVTTLMDNAQTRFLSGHWDAPYGRCTDEMLWAALRNLDSMSVVGLVEHFDASLLLLQRAFRWRAPYYIPVNVNSGRPGVEELSESARRLLRRHNELDTELYLAARRLFGKQVSAAGPGFEDRLHAFRRENAVKGVKLQCGKKRWKAKQRQNRAKRTLRRWLPFT